jgi:hypothetical protein
MTRHDLHAPAGRARRHPTSQNAHREEVIEMPKNAIRYVNAIHADRAARFGAEARAARIARAQRGHEQAADRRIRRAVGRSIVRIGARIAADPALERLQPAGTR